MSRSRLRRGLLLTGVALGAVLLPAGVAAAHPLGNFTVNSYSGVVLAPAEIRVDHVLDYAEIPTVQEKRAIGDDLPGYAARSCATSATKLTAVVGGARVPLAVKASSARLLEGQAGLNTLRVECDLRGTATVTGRTAVQFSDSSAVDHVGWHEITMRGDETTLSDSTVPTDSLSKRLTSYPQDMLKSPADDRTATASVRPGGARLVETVGSDTLVSRPADALSRAFTSLIGDGGLGVGAVVLALLLAAVIGAAHAVAPGHGKTVMAFYLAGRQARSLRAALTVGATVTATHTAGVLALGLLVSTGAAFTPTHAYPWLSMLSGLLVLAVGLNLVRTVRSGRAAGRPHSHGGGLTHSHGGSTHSHGGSSHSHGEPEHTAAAPVAPLTAQSVLLRTGSGSTITTLDLPLQKAPESPHTHGDHTHGEHGHTDHAHDHSHDHAEVEEKPQRAGLVAMGLAGGLVPSPTAVVVLLGAVATGHWWLGIVLVLAFGLGMAVTLTTVGIAVATAGERLTRMTSGSSSLSRYSRPVLRYAPVLAAVGVCTLGVVVLVRGLLAL